MNLEISKNKNLLAYKKSNNIVNNIGVNVSIDKLQLDYHTLQYLEASLYTKMIDLFIQDEKQYSQVVTMCVSQCITVSGVMHEVESITKLFEIFTSEIIRQRINITVMEFHIIMNKGARGEYGYYESKKLSISNFHHWFGRYKEQKQEALKKAFEIANKIEDDDEKIDYTNQENSLNQALKLKKKDQTSYRAFIGNLLTTLPEVYYNFLISKQKVNPDDYKKFLKAAEKNINVQNENILEKMFYPKNEQRLRQEAIRLTIINFINNYESSKI